MPQLSQYLKSKAVETINKMEGTWAYIESNYIVVQGGEEPPTHSFLVGVVEKDHKKYLVYQINK